MFLQSADPSIPAFKIVLLGDTKVGKTTLLCRQSRGCDPGPLGPTIGCQCTDLILPVDDVTVSLQVWDTAGQEMYRSLVPVYLRGAEGVIAVFDISEPDSFSGLQQWMLLLDEILTTSPTVLLVANKVDLDARGVDDATMEHFATVRKTRLFKTSALTGQGVEDLFVAMAEAMAQKKQMEVQKTGISLITTKEEKCAC
jgi:small GTP-binding protein